MRRRGRAQESTEGPDGPCLGYVTPQDVVFKKAVDFLWVEANPSVLSWSWAPKYLGVLTHETFYPNAVRSGRERLGE